MSIDDPVAYTFSDGVTENAESMVSAGPLLMLWLGTLWNVVRDSRRSEEMS